MNTPFRSLLSGLALLLLAIGFSGCASTRSTPHKLLLIAGAPSHPPGAHEHNAGMLLLQKCLTGVPNLQTTVALSGWPQDPQAFDGVDAIMIFSDGGIRHPALQGDHLKVLGALMDKGVSLGLIHYATEPVPGNGQEEFIRWVGGCFQINKSVNPHWTANVRTLPDHPVTRGVKPFSQKDEWYFNLRFAEGMKGVTPLLVAVPTAEETMTRKDGTHSGNPEVRAKVARGEPQTLAWAFTRPNGGRGFGTTGAHFHTNWGNEDFRKLVLNAAVWLSRLEVPAGGVVSLVTPADLASNLDPKPQPATGPRAK